MADTELAPLRTEEEDDDDDSKAWEKIVRGAHGREPPKVAKCLNACGPVLRKCTWCCRCCIPIYAKVFGAIFTVLDNLPTDLFGIVWGLCLVFFGGFYPLTLSAFEAFRQCGGEETYAAIRDLRTQFSLARAASREDSIRDDDGDGIPDVEQISRKELFKRKSHVVMASTDPEALDRGFQGVYTAWLAVVAVLKLEYAQMIAIASAIGSFLAKLLRVPLTSILVHVMNEDVHKWIPQCVSYFSKVVAITVAWYIQKILSAVYSSVRGGLMVSRSLMYFLSRKIRICKLDPETSYLDELFGWALAAVGFYFQLQLRFSPPFFVQILLWPFSVSEATLLWAITTAPEVEVSPADGS